MRFNKKRKPTEEESRLIAEVKLFPCIICYPEFFEKADSKVYPAGSEYHHICDTGRRLGHAWGLPLCISCHRGDNGFAGKNRSAWDKSLANQLTLCRKVYKNLGREMPELTTKIVKRNGQT